MPTIWILPPPTQLAQDYYAKQVLPPSAPTVPPVVLPSPVTPAPETVNNGGIWYGSVPPDNPANGWMWTPGDGTLYMYIDPGIWSQVGTNW